jgi:hypothetical protein
MTRYSHLRWLPALGGLVAAGVLVLSAAPSSATIVCPTGIKPPSPYCTNVPPTATTGKATEVKGTSATLNGVAGPNVSGGDITQYYFEYGRTTNYGSTTPPGTIGSCPSGISPPSPYCNVPKTEPVSARISNLKPCTAYHYQLVATNSDGTAQGGDQKFTTGFAPPIAFVSAPGSVRAGRRFQVKFTLRYAAKVKIEVARRFGRTVVTYNYGTLSAGRHKKTITAPFRAGNYTLAVIAKLSCGQQRDSQKLRVH